MKFRHLLGLTLLLPALAAPVGAAEYRRLLVAPSEIGFRFAWMGTAVSGRATGWQSSLAFDPARPAAARASIRVAIADLVTASPERDAEMKGAGWLDAGRHPEAVFELTSARALGGNRYEMSGRLSLHGQTRAVKTRCTLTVEGGRGVLVGQLRIKRLDYGIGESVWPDTGVVADVVRIPYRLVLEAGP